MKKFEIQPQKSSEFSKPTLGKLLFDGKTKAHEIQGEPDKVMLERSFSQEEYAEGAFDQVYELASALSELPDDVQAPKILKGWSEGSTLYQIMERSKGEAVHVRMKKGDVKKWIEEIRLLAEAPQAQYDKLIHDMKKLHEHGLSVDAGKSDNFFYDAQTGFHFIDLGKGDWYGSLVAPFLQHTNIPQEELVEAISSEIEAMVRTIIEKLKVAGDVMDHEQTEAHIRPFTQAYREENLEDIKREAELRRALEASQPPGTGWTSI